MATKVKDYYDVPYLEELAAKISAVTSEFNEKVFFELTKSTVESLEFNQRQELIAKALYEAFTVDHKTWIKECKNRLSRYIVRKISIPKTMHRIKVITKLRKRQEYAYKFCYYFFY